MGYEYAGFHLFSIGAAPCGVLCVWQKDSGLLEEQIQPDLDRFIGTLHAIIPSCEIKICHFDSDTSWRDDAFNSGCL